MTKPEQSKPAGLAPPHLYRAPRCFLAMATARWERDGEDFVSDRARIEGSTAGSTASSGARGREQSSAASARASAMLRLVALRFTRAMAALPCSAYAKAVLRETVEGPRHYDNARGEPKGTGVRASQKNASTLLPDHQGDFWSPASFAPHWRRTQWVSRSWSSRPLSPSLSLVPLVAALVAVRKRRPASRSCWPSSSSPLRFRRW